MHSPRAQLAHPTHLHFCSSLPPSPPSGYTLPSGQALAPGSAAAASAMYNSYSLAPSSGFMPGSPFPGFNMQAVTSVTPRQSSTPGQPSGQYGQYGQYQLMARTSSGEAGQGVQPTLSFGVYRPPPPASNTYPGSNHSPEQQRRHDQAVAANHYARQAQQQYQSGPGSAGMQARQAGRQGGDPGAQEEEYSGDSMAHKVRHTHTHHPGRQLTLTHPSTPCG